MKKSLLGSSLLAAAAIAAAAASLPPSAPMPRKNFNGRARKKASHPKPPKKLGLKPSLNTRKGPRR